VEVHDTGVGLHKRDVIDNRLLSQYVQTEIGRRQGGKGSGLGLALCMQIIRLCGGRLGVDSQVGQGSCFWFEIALLLPPPTSGDLVRQPHGSPPVVHAKLMPDSSFPPVIVNDTLYDKLYDSTSRSPQQDQQQSQCLSPPGDTRPQPASHASGTSSVLAPELELDTMNRQLAASVQDMEMHGAIPAERAIEMIERGFPPAVLAPLESQVPQTIQDRRQSNVLTTVQSSGATAEVAAISTSTPKPTSCAQTSEPLQVLVVDDDPLTRKLMARMLSRLGHRVTTAENGEVALKMMSERHRPGEWGEQFHIVFLDNQMPKMTGIECARGLRRMGCNIFIVGATGNALKEDQEEYNEAGADQVLTKPIKEANMRQMIEEARKRVAGETKPRRLRPWISEP